MPAPRTPRAAEDAAQKAAAEEAGASSSSDSSEYSDSSSSEEETAAQIPEKPKATACPPLPQLSTPAAPAMPAAQNMGFQSSAAPQSIVEKPGAAASSPSPQFSMPAAPVPAAPVMPAAQNMGFQSSAAPQKDLEKPGATASSPLPQLSMPAAPAMAMPAGLNMGYQSPHLPEQHCRPYQSAWPLSGTNQQGLQWWQVPPYHGHAGHAPSQLGLPPQGATWTWSAEMASRMASQSAPGGQWAKSAQDAAEDKRSHGLAKREKETTRKGSKRKAKKEKKKDRKQKKKKEKKKRKRARSPSSSSDSSSSSSVSRRRRKKSRRSIRKEDKSRGRHRHRSDRHRRHRRHSSRRGSPRQHSRRRGSGCSRRQEGQGIRKAVVLSARHATPQAGVRKKQHQEAAGTRLEDRMDCSLDELCRGKSREHHKDPNLHAGPADKKLDMRLEELCGDADGSRPAPAEFRRRGKRGGVKHKGRTAGRGRLHPARVRFFQRERKRAAAVAALGGKEEADPKAQEQQPAEAALKEEARDCPEVTAEESREANVKEEAEEAAEENPDDVDWTSH